MPGDAQKLDGRVALGCCAILAGVLSFLLIGVAASPAPRSASELLTYVAQHRLQLAFAAATALAWAVASIPFAVALGALLDGARSTLALAATLLSAGGALLLGFASFAVLGAHLAILAASSLAPSPAEAAYQAAIWSHLSFYLSDPGLMTLGLGQFLFAVLAYRTGTLPKLVAALGYVGGLAGLLTLAVYETGALAAVQIAAFGVWGIVAGIALFRRRQQPA